MPSVNPPALGRWKLITEFQQRLRDKTRTVSLHPTWSDPQRELLLPDYLGLFLLGLLNPVLKTTRALCAASDLERVQQELDIDHVSLGSFSEAQSLVDPQLLHQLFQELAQSTAARQQQFGDRRLAPYWPTLTVVDSTLWYVLPRMGWALWRKQNVTQRAVRLHLKFRVLTQEVSDGAVSAGKQCERRQWKAWAQPGEFYVGDRYYGEDYQLLGWLPDHGCKYVVRLRQEALWVVEQELPVSAEDRAAQVVWSAWVRLGKAGQGPRVRLVQVAGAEEPIYLVTCCPPEELSAELIALIYKYRWQIEHFFRWLKCILGCRHWFAESPSGVAIQIYLALIAAQLLLLFGSARPNKRAWELLQLYWLGWASLEETLAGLAKQAAAQKKL